MRVIIAFLSLLVWVSAIPTVDLDWETFKTKYNKQYSPEEDIRRFKIFTEKKIKIAEHNKKFDEGLVTFTMGINKFADMLPEETSYLKGYRRPSNDLMEEGSFFQPAEGVTYPDTVDWRDEGYVTPVKDQEMCGCCWAFSATGSLEGQNFKKTGTLVSLSEQNLVDCVPKSGCYGGFMTKAYHYVRKNGGIDTEDCYPYYAVDSSCKYNSSTIGGTCNGFRFTKPTDEDALLAATATIGPISVAIDASNWSFDQYSGGVYYEENCNPIILDHAVLVVGYGTTHKGEDYWLVKNSWGTYWGIDGYIKMSRNRGNNCGIASEASYPLV